MKIPIIESLFTNNYVGNSDGITGMLQTSTIYAIYTVIATCIIAPILEELVFRGLIMLCIFSKNKWLGYFISSFLFSLAHMPTNLYAFMNYFISGLIFGSILLITKSLRWSISTHIVNNLIANMIVLIIIFFTNL